MLNLDRSINALLTERESLLNQIDAIDRALAALRGTIPTAAIAQETTLAIPEVTRIRPKKVLSEAHKAALVEGRRKARLAKEISAGRAFELIETPALAQPISNEAPRLVRRRELTVEPDAEAQRPSEMVLS